MKNYISKNAKFRIIPTDPEGATVVTVEDIALDYFTIKPETEEGLKPQEHIEFFSLTPQGLLYFESIIKEISEEGIKVLYPISHKFLQRREYTRVDLDKAIELYDETTPISSKIIDISAGGLKLSSSEQLLLTKDYKISVNLDVNVSVNCLFHPIRIESDNMLGYTVSGRFMLLKNIDRIALVQYCFKKQMENQNK